MSRPKEVQVVIFDVNPSMGKLMKTAKEAILMHVQQKLIQTPKTEIGLVAVGTELTYSDLQEDGFENIFVKREIKQVDVELLKEVEGLEVGTDGGGDYLDALVVAADMIYKHCEKKTFEKSIILVTNFQIAGREPDALDEIAGGLHSQGISLTIHGLKREDTKTVPDGEKVLRMLGLGLEKAEVIPVEDGADLQGRMLTRSVKPTTTFRGFFEVSPTLKIKVWSYPATKIAAFPSIKKRRKVTADGEGGGGISTNRQYVLQDDNDQEIAKEDLIKAYKYGRDRVPASDTDAANMKVKADKGMWLLAFAPRRKVKPHYLMSNAEVVLADPTAPEPSTSMLAALAKGMKECTDREGNTVEHVAVVRWVRRQNDPPRLFCLFANIDEATNTYCLFACKLPFSEDLRRNPFSTLSTSAPLQPASEQIDATRAFVNALDVFKHKQAAQKVKKEEDGSEAAVVVALPMENIMVFNPVFQHFYRCVNHKALYGEEDGDGGATSTKDVPPPPEKGDLAKVLHPDERLWSLASEAVAGMKDAFKIPVLEEKAKRKAPDDAGDTAKGGDDGAIKIDDDDDDDKSKKPRLDGSGLAFSFAPDKAKDGVFDTTNPEGHFEMLWKREELDAHENAIKEMAKHVIDIVDNSPGERFYSKAVSCLKKLRVFCDAGRNDEPDLFNESFEQLRDKYQSRSDISFWAFMSKQGVERIRTSDEDEPPAPAPVAAAAPAAASLPDDDDLLDEAD